MTGDVAVGIDQVGGAVGGNLIVADEPRGVPVLALNVLLDLLEAVVDH